MFQYLNVRIAGPHGEALRLSREVRVRALEGIRAEIVVRRVRVIRAAVELKAGPDRVHPANVVEIRLHVDRLGIGPARLLPAAGVERVEDDDRGGFEGGLRIRGRDVERRAGVDEEAPSERPRLLQPQRVIVVIGRVAALQQVEPADAEVLAVGPLLVVLRAERLVARDRVVERAEHEQIVRGLPRRERRHLGAVRVRVVEVRRGIRHEAVDVDRERRLLLDDRSAEAAVVRLGQLGAFWRRGDALGLPAAQLARAHAHVHVRAQRPDARLRDDVDEQAARVVILGGECVARDVDRLDRRFRRQASPFETVDADDGVAAGHVLQLLRHLVGIVRERVDLFAGQRRAERALAIRRNFARVARHGHRILQPLDRQHDRVLVVARLETDVLQLFRFEAGELGLDRVTARRETGERGDSLVVCLHRFDRGARRVERRHGHRGVREYGARLIHHRDGHADVARALRARRRLFRWTEREQRDEQCDHFLTSNLFGSILTLTL